MYLPIRRWRAVVVGLALGLASGNAILVSAGVVAPPSPESGSTVKNAAQSDLVVDVAQALPLPTANDAQPFWYPGADGRDAIGAVSLTSTPIQSSELTPGIHGLQQHPLIPLPGAAWTGMAGLLGLGALKLLRNARRLLA